MAHEVNETVGCVLEAFERNRYFYGKLMTVRDFEQEQLYHNRKRWLINSLLFGTGTVCGLDVRRVGPPANPDPMLLSLSPGVALDACGREIVVPEAKTIDLRELRIVPPATLGAQKTLYLCLSFATCAREPVPALQASGCDETCDYNRILETYTVTANETAPPVAPARCSNWLNLTNARGENNDVIVERTAPRWAAPGEVIEVRVKVTAKRDLANLALTENISGATLIAGDRLTLNASSLAQGVSLLHLYRARIEADATSVVANGDVTGAATVEVVATSGAAQAQEAFITQNWLEGCALPGNGAESCVVIAALTITATAGGFEIVSLDRLARRFISNLPQLTELLECLKREGFGRPGPQGEPGPAGPAGPRGEQGPPGNGGGASARTGRVTLELNSDGIGQVTIDSGFDHFLFCVQAGIDFGEFVEYGPLVSFANRNGLLTARVHRQPADRIGQFDLIFNAPGAGQTRVTLRWFAIPGIEQGVPTITRPTLTIPTLPTLPTLTLTLPTLTLPTLTLPTLTQPTFTIPTLPTLTIPTLTRPTVTLPTLTLPTVTLPTLTLPTLTLPTLTLPTLTRPTLDLPTLSPTLVSPTRGVDVIPPTLLAPGGGRSPETGSNSIPLSSVTGVGANYARRLREAGIPDANTLATTPIATLVDILRINRTKASDLIAAAKESLKS